MERVNRAVRGVELEGAQIFEVVEDDYYAADSARMPELMAMMNADQPAGGTDIVYGPPDSNRVRFWKGNHPNTTLILFVHGGSWRSGPLP